MIVKNTKNLKVLTPDGYKSFVGIQKVNKSSCYVVFEDGKTIKCSIKHSLCVDLFKYKFKKAGWLKPGDRVFGETQWHVVKSVKKIGKLDLYDLVGVEDTSCYYTQGLLSHNCNFINSGTSSLNEQTYQRMKAELRDPIETLMNGKYKIYDFPQRDRIYTAGVDTSDGVGGDFSCIKILDITDLTEIREVAEFYDNFTAVPEFTNILYEILGHWGNPYACIERNNQGGQVIDRLNTDYGYDRIVSWGAKLAGRKGTQLEGMISSRNTKYKACANARYFYSDKGVFRFSCSDALEELFKDFVKVNDTWQAVAGKHDDRTMAMIWALMILDKEVCEDYFIIEEVDDCGKPLVITPIDNKFGPRNFTSLYTNEQVERIENSFLSPVSFGGYHSMGNEVDDLMADGWVFVNGGQYDNPDQNISDSQWETIDKYF